MSIITRSRWLLALGGIAFATACSSDSTGPNAQQALTPQQQEAVTNDFMDEHDETLYAFEGEDVINPTFELSAGPDVAASGDWLGPRGDLPRPLCATGTFGADTDRDRVRDVTLTYSAQNCTFSNFRGGSLVLTGTIAWSDPTPTVANRSYNLTYTDFSFAYTGPTAERSFTSVRNGTRQLLQETARVTLTNNVQLRRTIGTNETATIQHNLTRVFESTGGAAIPAFGALPGGTFVTTGTVTWSRGDAERVFTVSTPTPLQYDPSCTQRPRIVAGVLELTLASGAKLSFTWSGCGQRPTRVYTPAA